MNGILRTNSDNTDFITLVGLLDTELADRDGDENAFYAQFNGIEGMNHCVLLYQDGVAVGCGAIKALGENSHEIKRMYILPTYRGKGMASIVLEELENWAQELGSTHCILETGKRQPEAIRLYEKNAYQRIENYGQYKNVSNSVCFQKSLAPHSI